MSKRTPFQHDFKSLREARDKTPLIFKKVTNEEYENVLLNRIVQLEARLLEQDDYIRDLVKSPTGHGWVFPYQWELTSNEADILIQLCQFEVATKEHLYHALYGNRFNDKDLVEIRIIDVFICKIRKKIPFKIETIWGRGYRIDPSIRKEMKEKFFFSADINKENVPTLKGTGLD